MAWWFASCLVGGLAWACLALLALASGVTCLCWQLVRFALLEWAFALDLVCRSSLAILVAAWFWYLVT